MSVSIMIVDDDPDDIDIFIEAVSEVDSTIHCLQAPNAIAGITLVNSVEEKPDFIFVDMNMPKMNGRQFVEEIRKDKTFDHIKLIIYSTNRPENNVSHAADEHLLKPTSHSALCSEISKIISKFHVGHTGG